MIRIGTVSTSDSNGTRKRILDAAERLWAEEGIAPVSLNRIRRAAKERNSSVISYHFGTKDDLVRAVRARHEAALDQERLELLDQVDLSDRATGLRQVVEALVVPFSNRLGCVRPDCYYVQFAAHFYSDPYWRYSR